MTYLQKGIGMAPPKAAFITSLQFIVSACTAWLVGLLSDKIGTRKKILYVGYAIYFIALFLWPSQNVTVLTAFFVMIGLAAATIPPMVYSSMPEALSDKRAFIATGMAMIATGQGIGNFLGPTIGGALVDKYGWPWAAYWLAPVFIIALVLTWRLKVR